MGGEIKDASQVEPPFRCGQVRDVRQPDLVGQGCRELLLEEIGGDQQVITHGGVFRHARSSVHPIRAGGGS